MTMTELLNVVRPTKLLSADDILDAIKVKQESRNVDLNFRGALGKLTAEGCEKNKFLSLAVSFGWRGWLVRKASPR